MRKYIRSRSSHSSENAMARDPMATLTRNDRIRSRGSKLISVLRSLTNSVSSISGDPTNVPRKVTQNIIEDEPPTIVHRAQFKSRPSLIEVIPDGSSPPSSGGINSSKSFHPTYESTGKTSLDSKFSSSKSNRIAHRSSEGKRVVMRPVLSRGSGSELAPIAEVDLDDPEPVPTVVTVEKAVAAKVFFETHYNNALSNLTPRSIRRRNLEGAILEDPTLTAAQQDEIRRNWAHQESDHLRETRVMKAAGLKDLEGQTITASKYEVVKVLGKGSFGVVRLVREKIDENKTSQKRDVYAMKVIRKSDMLRNSQEGHLRAERDFLVAAEGSRWVVPLIASFQDLNNLYLVMDYMPGGDFLGLLIRDNVLSEPVTKWYIAEMILCIEEAHSLRWIHRDVKPDNFLISASGHLKISDFGLAFDGHWSHDQAYFNNHRYSLLSKLAINVTGDTLDRKEAHDTAAAMRVANAIMGARDRHERNSSSSEIDSIINWRNRNGNRTLAKSVVGTSQYMAPEVVKGDSYDARCDWWSVAVILYECLYGHTPFLAEEGGRQQTKMNILRHEQTFAFPHKPVVSKRCQDLIQKILQDKDHRLCSKRYTRAPRDSDSMSIIRNSNRDWSGRYVYPNDAEDIKAHKWFKDIPWDRLHLMTPPFVPNIKSMDDTHYFDEEDPISDFSESTQNLTPTVEDIAAALQPFNREIQILATGFIERPHDTVRLRKMEREIDGFVMCDEQKDYLKQFVKLYGKKEKKRPRDKLLRDKETAPKVLQLRKEGAFLGYAYKRIRNL